MKIAVVMVGCGAFARRYHVPAFELDREVRIAAIVDPTPAAETLALAQRHGATVFSRIADLPPLAGLLQEPQAQGMQGKQGTQRTQGAQLTQEAQEAQEADRPAPADRGRAEAAFALVTTPHALHAEHVDAMLDRGLPVLVDKPFVLRGADAARLADLAESAGLINAVAYNRRFDRNCRRAHDMIREGRIGKPRYVQTVQLGYERAGWFLVPELGGGGPYTGRASHMADLLPWLLDRTPTRLRSRTRTSSPSRSDHGGFIELQFDELECQMTCIEEGWHMWDEVRIFGDEGLIELRRPLSVPIGWSLECFTERMERHESFAADPTPGGATQNFIQALRGQGTVACSFRQAIPSVRLVELAFASAGSGGGWMET